MAIPSSPQNYILQQGNGQVYLSWSLVAGATSYQVQRSTDGVTFTNLVAPVTNSCLDASVTVGTQYFYQVASIGTSGTSSYTTPQSIVPTYSSGLSLGQIRLMSQQRADRVDSDFVTVPEWNTYINQSAFELYDILVTLDENYYLAPALLITPDGTSQFYDLPNGLNYSGAKPFYKCQGVDCGLGNSSNSWFSLRKFNFIGRNKYVYPNISTTPPAFIGPEYRIMGDKIEFIPTPSSGQILRLWYVPRLVQLLQDTDILDSISGWSEYVIVDAAIKALQKEESDVSVLMAQKEALKQRIMASAMNRDVGAPDTISDTRGQRSGWGGYYGDQGSGGGSFGGF